MHIYSIISLSAAAILPPLAAAYMVWHSKKTLRQMDAKLEEMRRLDRRRVMSKLHTNSQYGKGSLN